MRYIVMAHIDGSVMATKSPAEAAALTQRYVDFTRALGETGLLLAFEQLQPADTATTLRIRDSRQVLTDGPFAEVTEAFGGYWVVSAPDLDAALTLAADCPAAEVGAVEVRAIIELG